MQDPVKSKKQIFPFPDEMEIIRVYYKSSDLAWLTSTLDGEILTANKNFCTRLGYTLKELSGKRTSDLFRQKGMDIFLSDGFHKWKKGQMHIHTRDGSEQWLYRTIVIDDSLKSPYRVWYLENVIKTQSPIGDLQKERLLLENEINEKSRILNEIVNKLPVVIFKIGESGEFDLLQGHPDRIQKFRKSKTAKLSIRDTLKLAKKKLRKKTKLDDYFSFTSNYMSEGLEWHFENFLFGEQNNGHLITGFSIDITERKNSEQEMKRHTKNLQKINKELDQFAYVVSHDLKAPLRAINNLSEWIEEDLGNDIDSEIKSNLTLLRGRVHRLQALIDGILEYSRIGRIHMQPELIDTDKTVIDLIDQLGIPGNFKMIKKTSFPMININKLRFEQVFMNLISNSIKYHDKSSGTIEIDYEKAGSYHQFSVADDGPGIASEFHEKVFMIFQTLQSRDTVESTGVGLSIVKKIIEELGGKIWIESVPGQGAKFVFNVPVRNEQFNIISHD